MHHDPRQLSLFSLCASCGALTMHRNGRLRVTLCPDGRRLIRFETWGKDPPWLELLPEDAHWLAETLAREPGSANHGGAD